MAALVVAVAGLLDGHHLAAQQRVGQGGLAGAGLPDQRGGAAQAGAQHVEAVAGLGADHQHGGAGGDLLDVRPDVLGVVDQVGLGEHDQRLGAALVGEGEEPFDAAEVGLGGERDGDQHGVDVGGEHLAVGALAGALADDRGAARQQGGDGGHRFGVRVDGHPVAGARVVDGLGTADRSGVGAHGGEGAGLGVGDHHIGLAAVDPGQPAGDQAGVGEWGELLGQPVGPAVGGEQVVRGGECVEQRG